MTSWLFVSAPTRRGIEQSGVAEVADTEGGCCGASWILELLDT